MACIDIYRAIKTEKGAAHVEAAVKEAQPSRKERAAAVTDDPMPPI